MLDRLAVHTTFCSLVLLGACGDATEDAPSDTGATDTTGTTDSSVDDSRLGDSDTDETSLPASPLTIVADVTWVATPTSGPSCTYTRHFEGTEDETSPWFCPSCEQRFLVKSEITSGSACLDAVGLGSSVSDTEWIGLAHGTLYRASTAGTVAYATYTPGSNPISVSGEFTLDSLGVHGVGSGLVTLGHAATDPTAERVPSATYACGWSKPSPAPPAYSGDYAPIEVGDLLPDGIFQDACGDWVRLHDLGGKWMIVEFGALDCQPCQAMAEAEPYSLHELEAVQIDATMVSLLSYSLEDIFATPTVDDLKSWNETYGLSSPVLADRGYGSLLNDRIGSGSQWPSVMVVDPTLHVVAVSAEVDLDWAVAFIKAHGDCKPACEDRACGDDLCGGTCGTCDEGLFCSPDDQCVPPILGDGCGMPHEIASIPANVSGDTGKTPNEPLSLDQDACGPDTGAGSFSADEIWRFVAPTTSIYAARLHADYDAAIYAVSDCADASNHCLAVTAWPDDFVGHDYSIFFSLDAGQSAYVVVDGNWGWSGTYTMAIDTCTPECEAPGGGAAECGSDGCGGTCGTCAADLMCAAEKCVPPPQGDRCADPFRVTALPFTDTRGVTGLRDDYHVSVCANAGWGDSDAVYGFTPTTTGSYRITVTPSSYLNTAVYVLTDCADPDAKCVAGANDADLGDPETVTTTLTAGTAYAIVVEFGGDAGDSYTLKIEAAP